MMKAYKPQLKLLAVALMLIVMLPAAACGITEQQKIDDANEAARSSDTESSGDGSKRISVFDLRDGDCYNEPDLVAINEGETLDLDRVELVPCTSPHDFEVLRLFLVELDENTSYPGEPYFDDLFISECPLDSDYFIFPQPESWEFGDRVLTCLRSAR